MENLLEYNHFSHDKLNWIQEGLLFIKGEEDESGKSGLFLFKIKSISSVSKKKKGGESGVPVHMAILYPEIYKIGYTLERKLVARKVMPSTKYLEKFLGLSTFKVGLNQNKTPNWKNTVGEKSIGKVLGDAEIWIKGEDWADIPIFNP